MNLEKLNLVELDAREAVEIDGGFPIFGYNVASAIINGAQAVGSVISQAAHAYGELVVKYPQQP